MPYSIVMQQWVRVHGSGASMVVVQDEAEWIDIGAFSGITPWVQVGFFGGSPVLSVETSPIREDAYFKQMVDQNANASSWSIAAAGQQSVFSFAWDLGAVVPPGKWLRWKITGGANWRAVFRITLTAVQGRGGSFQHACVALPEDARKHPDDHAHAAQAILRARAAQNPSGSCDRVYATAVEAPLRGRHDDAIDSHQAACITVALLSKFGRATTVDDETRTRAFVNAIVRAQAHRWRVAAGPDNPPPPGVLEEDGDSAEPASLGTTVDEALSLGVATRTREPLDGPGEPPPDPDDVATRRFLVGSTPSPSEPPPDPDDIAPARLSAISTPRDVDASPDAGLLVTRRSGA